MTEMLDTKVEKNGLAFYGKFSEGLFEEWLKVVNALPSKERIQDDMLLQIGFNIYKLVQLNMGQFRILSVNYETNPFKEFTDDLTLALWIQSEQSRLAKELKTETSEIRFDEKIVLAKGVFESEYYYLQRQVTDRKGDSGWFVGYQNQDTDDFIAIYAFEILKKNPKLIRALILPADYLVVVNGGDIQAILNEQDEEVFSAS